eukprot:NODE_1776_length_1064_cov_628.483647.p1 GENE.NODE_1776_length_1064_cov_628.483647~~NODE_1776_length_1064_cov_628.483647.p1  ORF type:complete len:293 (+),score=32.88 NODE_1776_length_1064_cov_628.483647:3-881(+)
MGTDDDEAQRSDTDDDEAQRSDTDDDEAQRSVPHDDEAHRLYGSRLTYSKLSKTGTKTMGLVFSAAGLHNLQVRPEFSPLRAQDQRRFVIGTIRNPCEWYVSLYSYCAAERGWFHLETPSSLKRVNDPKTFRKWLRWVSHSEKAPSRDLVAGPGLLSVRFAKAFTYEMAGLPEARALMYLSKNAFHQYEKALKTFDASNVDCWIHTGNFAEGVRECLRRYEGISGVAIDWNRVEKVLRGQKQNKSTHKPCVSFFDEQAEAFVRSADAHMFRLFNFTSCCDAADAPEPQRAAA